MPDLVAAPAREAGVQGEADRPPVGLGLTGELRFEDERVDQQREEGADVGKGVETIRRNTWVGLAEPGLEERASGGKHEVGQAEAGEEQDQDVSGRVGAVSRLPLVAWRDWQQRHCERQEAEVRDDLTPRRQAADAEVRVGVAAEEEHLKEEHARRPDRGAAAEPREDEARNQRLDEEEQAGSPEDGQAEGEHGGGTCLEPRRKAKVGVKKG